MNVRYFEKRPGSWHLDLRLPDGRRLRPYGGPTEAEARRNAAEVIARAVSAPATPQRPPEATVAPSGPSIHDAFKLAMRTRGTWMTSKAKATLDQTYGSLGLPDELPCATLTRDYVRDLRAKWMDEPGKRKGTKLSPSTINHRLSMLSALLEAVDLAPHNVKHLSTKGNARHRRITPQEFAAMCEWAAEQVVLGRSGAAEFARLLPVGLGTGARLSELLDLQKADLGPATVTFRDTKNGLTRTIPLVPLAREPLEAVRGLPAPFPTLTTDRVTVLWALMRKSMGLEHDQRFVFHLLRHECASRFADEGRGAHFIKAWLGHENIATSESYVNMSVGGLAAQVGVDLTGGASDASATVP